MTDRAMEEKKEPSPKTPPSLLQPPTTINGTALERRTDYVEGQIRFGFPHASRNGLEKNEKFKIFFLQDVLESPEMMVLQEKMEDPYFD